MNYLQLTNAVLAELNEVKLTSSNFASGAVGIQQTTKDVVNKSLRDVYSSEMEWPWLHSDATQVTYAGQKEYTLPTDYRSVDYDSFYLVPSELVTNSTFDSNITGWSTVSGTPAYNSGGNGQYDGFNSICTLCGNEEYEDLNDNGQYDQGEPFVDEGEPAGLLTQALSATDKRVIFKETK